MLAALSDLLVCHPQLVNGFHFVLPDVLYELLSALIHGLQLLVSHIIHIEVTGAFVVIFALVVEQDHVGHQFIVVVLFNLSHHVVPVFQDGWIHQVFLFATATRNTAVRLKATAASFLDHLLINRQTVPITAIF